MTMAAECLLYDDAAPIDVRTVARFAALSTANLSDSMQRTPGAVGLLTAPGGPARKRVAGRAMTVRTRPGDNLVVHRAMDLAQPGDVLVVEAGGSVDRAIVGGLLARYAWTRGLAAIVVDGAVRDLAELAELDIPVFARGVSHLGPYKDGPGSIRCPISLGGTPVSQGDLVVADEDGVVNVPRHRLAEVAEAAEALAAQERAATDAINEGRWDRPWVDASLALRPITRTNEQETS